MTKYFHSYFLVGLLSCVPGNAFAVQERVTLMLTGPACNESYQTIDRVLHQYPGVRHVDFDAVPGHVLVDIEAGAVTVEAIESQVNDIVATQSSCRAEMMKSCISAGPRPSSMTAP